MQGDQDRHDTSLCCGAAHEKPSLASCLQGIMNQQYVLKAMLKESSTLKNHIG